jgi:hypothetical protein
MKKDQRSELEYPRRRRQHSTSKNCAIIVSKKHRLEGIHVTAKTQFISSAVGRDCNIDIGRVLGGSAVGSAAAD